MDEQQGQPPQPDDQSRELGQSDFETWMRDTFYGRDIDLKVEATQFPTVLNYDQALRLAAHIWDCMSNAKPPWTKHAPPQPDEWARRLAEEIENLCVPSMAPGLRHRDQGDIAALIARAAAPLREENERLRKILAHVPARIAIKAKEDAGFGEAITTRTRT